MQTSKLSLGQNLKLIRANLNFKQYEISGSDVTRNLVSLAENDKTPISENLANIISKNMNKILLERREDIYIEAEDILNPKRYKARTIANNYINELKKHIEKKDYNIKHKELVEIEGFLNKWNFIDKKIIIYELLGDIYYHANNPIREYYYYIKSLEISYGNPNMKNRYKLILKIVHNCIVTKNYREAVGLCEIALSNQKDIPEKGKGLLYYNISLSYCYLEKYKKSLCAIFYAKLYVSYKDYKAMKKIFMLEAISNYRIKDYDGALRGYNNLLKILNDNPIEMCSTYLNIAQIYMDKDNKLKATECLNKTLEQLPKIDNSSYSFLEIIFNIADIYYYFKDYNSYEKYLIKGLGLSIAQENTIFYSKIISLILDFYIKHDHYDKINILLDTYGSQIYNLDINEDSKVILKIIYSYTKQNNNSNTESLIKELLRKGGNKDEN